MSARGHAFKKQAVVGVSTVLLASTLSSCALMGGVNGGAVGAAAKAKQDADKAEGSCSAAGGGKYTPIKMSQKETIRKMIGVAKHEGVNRHGQIIATMVMLQESGIHVYANDGTNPRGSGDNPRRPDNGWPSPGRAFWLKTSALSLKEPHELVGNDADSVGHFQQRASMEWANDASFKAKDHPEEAIRRLMSITWESWQFFGGPGGSPNRGLKEVRGWETMTETDAADAVQGSGFPAAYQKWVGQATQLVDANQDAPAIDPSKDDGSSSGGSSSSASPSSSSSGSASSSSSAAADTGGGCGSGGSSAGDPGVAKGAAKDILDAAKKWLGVPYSWGGGELEGPGYGYGGDGVQPNAPNIKGFDCSGLVRYAVYQGTKKSITLPRTAAQQYAATNAHRVQYKDLQPGDLMFWGASAGSIHHVAIYMGNGKMIDENHPGGKDQIRDAYVGDFVSGTRLTYVSDGPK